MYEVGLQISLIDEELERREDRMHHLEEAIEEEMRSSPDAEPTNKRINGLLTESLEGKNFRDSASLN